MRRAARLGWPILAFALVMGGCQEAAGGGGQLAVRDSAGIEIIENRRYAWGEGEGWRLADAPEVDIGVVEGDSVYQLFRVVGATLLSDGRVAVANSGTGEVRVFGADGRFVSAAGRVGEGPGEFRRMSGLWSYRGDSMAVWDPALIRVTVLSPDGSVARQARLDAAPSNPGLLSPLRDGSVIVVDERFNLSGQGVQQQEMVLTLHDPLGALEDSLGSLPFTKTIEVGVAGGTMVGRPLFSAGTSVAVSGDSFIVGTAAAPEVEVRSRSGAVVRRIRWPDQDRTVGADDVAQYVEHRLTGVEDEDERRQRRQYYGSLPHEELFPAYRQIETDAAGGVWVERFRRPGDDGTQRWLVIDVTGRALGEVTAPERFRVLEFGADYLLGVEPDELDIEHVRLYRIVKPEGGE